VHGGIHFLVLRGYTKENFVNRKTIVLNYNMKQLEKKTKFNIKQITAIERIAMDPGYETKKLSNELNVHRATINRWKNDVGFILAVYERFMDIAGKHMPDVIMAQIEEALAGNTQAATLVLKHFGKFQDSITIKIESPFDQFLKTNNVEDAEIIEVEDAIAIGNSFELPEVALKTKVERDPINDKPITRVQRENKKMSKIYRQKQIKKNRSERYLWLQRANKIGISKLGQGRPSPDRLRAWHNSIVKAENDLANGIVQDIQKTPD